MAKATTKTSSKSHAWPAGQVDMRPLLELTANPKNARKHPEAQIVNLVGLMRAHGWTTALLADEKGQLIAGHGRLLAASRLKEEGLPGFDLAPVMTARGWTAAQKRAYALADNRVALQSTWDSTILNTELGALSGLGVDLKALGFSEAELFRAIGSGGGSLDTIYDPTDGPAVSKPGDVWILGKHRLVCGDSTQRAVVDACLAGGKPHLMVTDPPYGVNYDSGWRTKSGITSGQTGGGKVRNDDNPDWVKVWMLFEGAVAHVWHSGLTASIVHEGLRKAGFDVRAQIIWVKQSSVIGRGHYHWQHENAWYAVRPGGKSHWQGDRKQSTVWEITHQANDSGHSTQKPLEAMQRPIINSSQPGDLVFEPFSGSGTTIIACEVTGRCCRAIELEPAYVDVAVRRWQDAAKQKAVLEESGLSFELTEHARLGVGKAGAKPKAVRPRKPVDSPPPENAA